MLSVRCLRALSSFRSVSGCKEVRCPVRCVSSCYNINTNKDTWFGHITPPGNRTDILHSTDRRGPFRSCCTGQERPKCWSCQQVLDQTPAFFCTQCKVIQPTDEERASYFHILDCEHTFALDTQKLQRRYLQLQRILHPDNFSQRSTKIVKILHRCSTGRFTFVTPYDPH